MKIAIRVLGLFLLLPLASSAAPALGIPFHIILNPLLQATGETVTVLGSGTGDLYDFSDGWDFQFEVNTSNYLEPGVPRDYLSRFRLYNMAPGSAAAPFIDADFSNQNWPSDTALDALTTSTELNQRIFPALRCEDVLNGYIYVEVTTRRFPNGALRGNFAPNRAASVPEPGSLALLATGILPLFRRLRRNS